MQFHHVYFDVFILFELGSFAVLLIIMLWFSKDYTVWCDNLRQIIRFTNGPLHKISIHTVSSSTALISSSSYDSFL